MISVKVCWEQWCRWNCDLRVINAQKQAFLVVPKASPWRWKSCAYIYAHCVTLGSHCKMASSHRVTDLEKNPVWISKNEALTPLSVAGPLFISPLLFHLSRTLLGALHFSLFHSVYLSQQARPHQEACLLLGVLFYFPNLSLFVLSYVKMNKFCLF